MQDSSICVFCGYPIIFRYRPPQMYHLPSGWHCWSQRAGEAGVSRGGRSPRIRTTTPMKERRPLVQEAQEKYQAYLEAGDPKPLLKFLKRQLSRRRGDVVRDFLGELADAVTDPEARDELVRGLVATAEWRQVCDELKEKAPGSGHRSSG